MRKNMITYEIIENVQIMEYIYIYIYIYIFIWNVRKHSFSFKPCQASEKQNCLKNITKQLVQVAKRR